MDKPGIPGSGEVSPSQQAPERPVRVEEQLPTETTGSKVSPPHREIKEDAQSPETTEFEIIEEAHPQADTQPRTEESQEPAVSEIGEAEVASGPVNLSGQAERLQEKVNLEANRKY